MLRAARGNGEQCDQFRFGLRCPELKGPQCLAGWGDRVCMRSPSSVSRPSGPSAMERPIVGTAIAAPICQFANVRHGRYVCPGGPLLRAAGGRVNQVEAATCNSGLVFVAWPAITIAVPISLNYSQSRFGPPRGRPAQAAAHMAITAPVCRTRASASVARAAIANYGEVAQARSPANEVFWGELAARTGATSSRRDARAIAPFLKL